MLKNKRILIISPQSWGNMFIAKHHYAIELAKSGNEVYFLDPPSTNLSFKTADKRIRIEPSGVHENLFIIRHDLFFPYRFYFHGKKIFLFFMKFQVKSILKKIGKNIDIVWSFDLGNMYRFSFFPADAYKIFHPVDEPTTQESLKSGEGADIIFSVTNEILGKYAHRKVPSIFIHHGVSESFFTSNGIHKSGEAKRVGLSGNFLRPDIDREILLQIIQENRNVVFECWGAYEKKQANLGGDYGDEASKFVDELKKSPNVILHGPVKTKDLAGSMRNMDAFLICYDVNKDASKGTNYHKVMEYLSTGRVVISNNVTTYKDREDLVMMVKERDHNKSLPALFSAVMSQLEKFNSPELQERRIRFAKENLYHNKIPLI
ncbi:MAG TPA: hypothetical protein VJT83_07105, partial [Chitinophagaceae bacterium]|nr:hypothetical protein [Chitinophagaceae bacterium]